MQTGTILVARDPDIKHDINLILINTNNELELLLGKLPFFTTKNVIQIRFYAYVSSHLIDDATHNRIVYTITYYISEVSWMIYKSAKYCVKC